MKQSSMVRGTMLCIGVILLASAPTAECKKHYKAKEQISKDHPMVKASASWSKNCLFEFENDDKFCQEYQSYLDLGFSWVQENQNYDPDQRYGYHNLDLEYYAKFFLSNYYTLRLQRLMETQLQIDWPETYFKYVTGIHYNRYTNFLCLEMFTDVTDFILQVQHSFQFVQCYKVLVNCMNDFGQWFSSDTTTTEKPFSPYAKWFDYCSLSGSTTFMIQQYQPVGTNSRWLNPQFRFVGSGSFDDGCFPGQIDYWIFQLEKVWSPSVTGANAPNPFYQGGLDGKFHPEHENFEGTFLTNTLGPWIQKLLTGLFDNLDGKSHKQSYGTWTNMEKNTDADDEQAEEKVE